MSPVEDTFRRHPIVSAVIVLQGLDIANLPWTDSENSPDREISIPMSRNRPSLVLSERGSASVRWRAGGHPVSFLLETDGYGIVTLEGQASPDTMLTAMAGMTLAQVVDMPGADAMIITEAVNSRAFISDPLSTRMGVRPAGEQQTD
jgi:hypothetical protein